MPLMNDGKNLTFGMYAGHINVVPEESQDKIFYIFVESQNNASNDPLIIWTNGGPGCSSMIGFAMENGPFIIENETFVENLHSWNKNANVIYFDHPTNVGFSGCDSNWT